MAAKVVKNSKPNIVLNPALLDASVVMTKVYMLPAPLCCISSSSDKTTVAKDQVISKYTDAYCDVSVAFGAGYSTSYFPMANIARWTLYQSKFLCFTPSNRINILAKPTGGTINAGIGPKDDLEFLRLLDKHVPAARGRTLAKNPTTIGEFTSSLKCGMSTRKLAIMSDGKISIEEMEHSCTTRREVESAFVEDIVYIRATDASILQRLLLGGINRIEVVFLRGDLFYFELLLPPEQQDKMFAAIKQAMLGRSAKPNLKVITAPRGELAVGPEFTTVEITKGLCLPLLASRQRIAIKTTDIAYLRAKLPSWQAALVAAIRDIEFARIGHACVKCIGTDLINFAATGMPMDCAATSYLLLILYIKALISMLNFLLVFFCRKTALILGGPGPGKEVDFPVEENPEQFLHTVGAEVVRAQKMHSWVEGGATAPAASMLVGASKDSSERQFGAPGVRAMSVKAVVVPSDPSEDTAQNKGGHVYYDNGYDEMQGHTKV